MSYYPPSKLKNNGFIAFDFDMDDDEKLYHDLKVDHPAKKKTEKIAQIYLNKYLERKVLTQKASSNSASVEMRSLVFEKNKEYINKVNIDVLQMFKDNIFEHLQTKKIKITDTQLVKFRQFYNKVPVYGSLATVELDKKNELIGISANFGQPNGTSPFPKIRDDEAKYLIHKKGYDLAHWEIEPRLYYYFDSSKQDWRLVYIIETKLKQKFFKGVLRTIPKLVDYIIDAHTGDVISELPHVRTLTSMSNKKR